MYTTLLLTPFHPIQLNIASSDVSICKGILESLGYTPRTHFGHKHTHNFGKGCFYQAGHDWYHARGNGEMCHSGHENGTPWRRVCACQLPRSQGFLCDTSYCSRSGRKGNASSPEGASWSNLGDCNPPGKQFNRHLFNPKYGPEPVPSQVLRHVQLEVP